MFKKVCLTVVSLMCLLVMVSSAADAAAAPAAKIGIIEPQRVLTQHPGYQGVMNELREISMRKESEARAAAEKETDETRRAQLVMEKRRELADEERTKMDPLFKDIDLAIRAVAKNKGLTLIFDKTAVFFGGDDITEDVIQQVKKQALLN